MQQLRNLYDHKEVAGALFRDSISIQKIMRGDQYEGFDRFVDEMIEKKEKRISEIVDKEKF